MNPMQERLIPVVLAVTLPSWKGGCYGIECVNSQGTLFIQKVSAVVIDVSFIFILSRHTF